MTNSDGFWVNRIVESGAADPQELAKGMNPLNWRGHPESQREALEEALESIGFLQRVLVNRATGRVIDGHLRIELAVLKGQPLIPVDYVELTEDEEALALATLDAITEQAEPIADKLAALLARTRELTADKPRLAATMNRLRERAGLVGNGNGNGQDAEPEVLTDRAEELQAKWQVKPSDLFEFESKATPGRFHRLLCGDCRNPDDMARLMDGQKVNGCFTSPPYAEQRKKQYGGVPTAEYVEWWEAVQTNVRSVLAEDGSFFVNIKPHCENGQRVLYVFDLVLAMVRVWGWRFVDELCWKHSGFPLKPYDHFSNAFEPVYQFSVGDFKFYPSAVKHATDRAFSYKSGLNFKQTARQGYRDVVDIDEGLAYPRNVIEANFEGNNSNSHAAAFPVALPTFFIRAYSDPGDSWLDPFAGSGTVAMAAEIGGRLAFMTEILPKYCAVICERLEVSGLHPHRLSG